MLAWAPELKSAAATNGTVLHSWRRESLFHILQLSAQRFARHQVIFASYHLDWCEGVEFKVGTMTSCVRTFGTHRTSISLFGSPIVGPTKGRHKRGQ